jgi:hypothetical protein
MENLKRPDDDEASDLLLLRPVIEPLAAWTHGDAVRSPEFWDRQRTAVLSKIPALQVQPGSRNPAWAWAVAAAVLAIAVLMLDSGPRIGPTQQAEVDSDSELLFKIERAMQTGGPSALEPAALLADEIEEHGKTNFNQTPGGNNEE